MKHILSSRIFLPALLGWAATSLFSVSHADERRFAYSYEVLTYIPGSVELESWMTWKDRDNGFGRFDFRHELELGVTEKFRLGLYFADWRYQEGQGESFHDFAVEGIYNLSNANTDWIGASVYGEVKFAKDFLELEGKLLLQKNFGPLAIVYNAIIEAEWEDPDLVTTKGVVGQTGGISYMFSPHFTGGFELLSETEFPGWGASGDTSLFFGPNVSFRGGKHYLTAAALWEMTETGEPDFQIRTIWGIDF